MEIVYNKEDLRGGIVRIMKKASGFTFVQLCVVIALIGILAAIGIPSYLTYLPKYRLKSAARDLYSNLQLAKMAAIKANENCRVTYSTGPDRYTATLLNKTVILGDYGSGIEFNGPNSQTFARSTITFNSRGTSNSGYAYLSNSSHTEYYRVGPLTSGVIKLQQWAGGSLWK